jgi:hypothetical protein
MARTFEPLARRLCKSLHAFTEGKPDQWVSVAQVSKIINVSDESLIEGSTSHAQQMGWLTIKGNPMTAVQLTEAGVRAGQRKK